MAGHGVPHAAWLQPRHSHDQLATLHLSGQNVFADHPVVGVLKASAFHLVFLLHNHHALAGFPLGPDQNRGILFVSRCAVDIKLCRTCGVRTVEHNVPAPHSDVHTFLEAHLVFPAVNGNDTGAADIDHSHFPSLQEIFRPQLVPRSQSKR